MGRIKKKYESGAATAYVSRSKAVKKLQLSLADFRRLCILKGIYPHEPKHKKVVGKGSTAPKTYYYMKDIQYLAHEPIINKFREYKHFIRRLRKAYGKGNKNAAARIQKNKPKYKLHHIVKERYPTFIDAVRDLDDCLSMIFLFSTFPNTKCTYAQFIQLCRRLSVEFMHYVISSKSLRKVFVSIKGIYYQAEVFGQTVTWIVPHSRGFAHPSDVDYRIMQTFVEFYTSLLGFVNFKLYNSINLHYPPKLALQDTSSEQTEKVEPPKPPGKKNKGEVKKDRFTEKETQEERLSALTQTLMAMDAGGGEEEVQLDDFPAAQSDDPDRVEQAKVEMDKLKKLQGLFKGLKFFLGREVPREPLVFIIRSFGGEVSWPETLAAGYTYPETDEKITHQIVDRPSVANQYLSRYYVQPQWVFDCVNARLLLPPEEYFMGAVLPPHLSPFVTEQEGDYVPPEKQVLLNRQKGVDSGVEDVDSEVDSDQDDDDVDEEEDDEDEMEEEEEGEEDEEDSSDEDDVEEQPKQKVNKKDNRKRKVEDVNTSTMSVEAGKVEEDNVERRLQRQNAEEKRLAEMMIPKKKRRLYAKIMHSKKKRAQEARVLTEKRQAIDKEAKKSKKKQKA